MLERPQVRHLRMASFLEGLTLLILVLVAVPAKHLLGMPLISKVMGPVHGLAFLYFIRVLVSTVAAGGWTPSEVARLVAGSFIPLGAFVNSGLLKQKEQSAA